MSNYIDEIQEGTLSQTDLPSDITIQAPFWYNYIEEGYSQNKNFSPSSSEFNALLNSFTSQNDNFQTDDYSDYQNQEWQTLWQNFLSSTTLSATIEETKISQYSLEGYLESEYLNDIISDVSTNLTQLEEAFQITHQTLSNFTILLNIFNKKKVSSVTLNDDYKPALSINTDEITLDDYKNQVLPAYNELKDIYTGGVINNNESLYKATGKILDGLHWFTPDNNYSTTGTYNYDNEQDRFTAFKELWVANKVTFSGIIDYQKSGEPTLTTNVDDGDIAQSLREGITSAEFFNQLEAAKVRKDFFVIQEFLSSARSLLRNLSETIVLAAKKITR